MLSGGVGTETYIWEAADIFDGISSFTDVIMDYSVVDILDFTALDITLADVSSREAGANTIVSVDLSGATYDVVNLSNVSDLDLAENFADGLLLL